MSGVYISYPFCAQKCTYCNFASGVFTPDLERRYVAALEHELTAHSWAWMPDTVYLGGGTPSRIAPEQLVHILARIPGRPWKEATMEAAPGTIDVQKARVWADAGINRVSLGVQTFVGRELARTGRKHTPEMVVRDIEVLGDCGIRNINIDLIAGLPAQTLPSWRASLEWIERLTPPHVSVYMLEVDEDSRLGKEVLLNGKRYGAPETPSDDAVATMYEMAVGALGRLGIARYEISNFARPGCESAHNLKYWRREPYVGFGADAHSFDGRTRFQNVESAAEYVDCLERRKPALLSVVDANAAEEKFFVGLRLSEGVRIDQEDWRRFGQPISRFLANGLLERGFRDGNDDALRLTDRGVLLSNEILQEFITLG
jgi:oxygen-independent coproporphyrinogen-3 oxidase